jgi:hypothetical protein
MHRSHSSLNTIFNIVFRPRLTFHSDIPDHGQLLFVLGSVILYPQSRVELSVLRQQMIESGGKKILLNAVDAGSEDAESIFYQSLDKILDNLRKVFLYVLFTLKATDFRSALLLGHKECNRSFQ